MHTAAAGVHASLTFPLWLFDWRERDSYSLSHRPSTQTGGGDELLTFIPGCLSKKKKKTLLRSDESNRDFLLYNTVFTNISIKWTAFLKFNLSNFYAVLSR